MPTEKMPAPKNPSTSADFRALLKTRKPLPTAWLGLGSSLVVETVAEAGWPVVVIDQQHGAGGNTELLACLTAARAAHVPALVRIAHLDTGLISRALDAGAQGVIVPMIDTAEDAARLVQAAKFPPLGGRSFGPYRGKFLIEGDYVEAANAWTIACGQIETKRAVENVDAICAVEGLDMICLGPNDLALSLSNGRHRDIRAKEVREAIAHVHARATAAGVITFIFANDAEYAREMARMGWQSLAIGTDANWLSAIAAQMLPQDLSSD
ncbi:MAG: HpcH/HpaI aldolase/citrate lyase family protein [Hyphomicrobium sp.]